MAGKQSSVTDRRSMGPQDEPRRSVRATKGQHTKTLDLMDQAEPTKKKSGKKTKKAAEVQEDAEVIRCVCGAVESPENDPEPWIACDSCGVWQHNVCVGVTTFDEDIPEKYLCEECDAVFHKDLLESLKRGVKIWEERRRLFEKEVAEEENGSKKKGKKKGKRISDSKPEAGNTVNGKAVSPFTPVAADAKKKDIKTGSIKRKVRDELNDKDILKEPAPKIRKVSAQQTSHNTPQARSVSPTTNFPMKIADLDPDKQPGAKLILKALYHALPISIKKGAYVLSPSDTVGEKAERLAIQINEAVWSTHPDKAAWSSQARALFNNLKSNQELCNGLLNKTLTVHNLAVMSSDDMANKEMKQATAEMKALADKQSIMVTDDGPRIRRTHKGEEVIEDDGFAVAADTTTSTSRVRRRSMLDPNAEMATRSRENSPGNEVELPDNIDYSKSRDDIRSQVAPKQPLNIETKQTPVRKASTQADFDINKVFSSVQSPISAHPNRRPSTNNSAPANGPGIDPEIDRMLQDDDGNESPPYSPAEFDSDPDVIWLGTVAMDSIAKFPASAKHIAGVDIKTMAWGDILLKELKVAGRIDQEKANEYLCSLRYSPPTDVVVVNITPTGELATQGFQALYNYFNSKNRYGVLTNKGTGNVRDTYLVPVPPTPHPLPDFITNLEGHKVPEERPEPMVLVALVIRNDIPNDPQPDAPSPTIMSHPQRQMSISGTGPSMSPIVPSQQSTFPSMVPPQHANSHPSPDEIARRQHHQQDGQRERDQRTGEETARRMLGPFVEAPTVAFLMPQAYQMRPVEWDVVRSILEEDARARVDLQHLSQVLESRMAAQHLP